ncbi:MAG: MFS transporter [Ilumatobacteraceae bacterium]
MGGRLPARLRAATSAVATVVANRDLRRAQMSFASAWTAELTLTVALGVVAFRDGGATTLGAVAFLRMLPAAVLAPWGTALADRFPRDRVLRWSCALRGALLAATALTLALDGPIVIVYALAIAATGAFATYRPAHSALLPALCVTPVELTSAYVARGFISASGALVGPIIAAVLLAMADPAAAFAVAAALALWSGWSLVGLSYEVPPHAGPASRLNVGEVPSHRRLAGFRTLVVFRDARLLVVLAAVQTFTRGCLNVLLIVVAIDLLGGGDADVGILAAALGAGAILGAVVVMTMRRHGGLAALLGIGVALWGLPLVVIAALPRQIVVLAMMAAIGIGDALVDVGLFSLPTRFVPNAVLARWFGALESVIALTVALGALVVAPLIAGLGARWTLAIVGVLGPVSVIASWRHLRTIDGSVTVRDDVIESLQRIAMLRPLPMPAIETLAAGSERTTVDAGHAVFTEGDHGDRFFVIERGEARVQRKNAIVRVIGAGDCFGEIALLRDVARTATVLAVTDLELRTIDRDHFLAIVNGYAASATAASTLVTDRLASDGAPGSS